jgi:hypothetical protein
MLHSASCVISTHIHIMRPVCFNCSLQEFHITEVILQVSHGFLVNLSFWQSPWPPRGGVSSFWTNGRWTGQTMQIQQPMLHSNDDTQLDAGPEDYVFKQFSHITSTHYDEKFMNFVNFFLYWGCTVEKPIKTVISVINQHWFNWKNQEFTYIFCILIIVAYLLKARTVKPAETAVASEQSANTPAARQDS